VHILELSTAVVEVDITVINASLTENQFLLCLTPPLGMLRYSDRSTPLN